MGKLSKYLCVGLLAVAICSGCSSKDEEVKPRQGGILDKFFKKENKSVPVTVANALLRERSVKVSAIGNLAASDRVEFTNPDDVKIDRILVSIGESVDIGDAVARISEDQINFKLGQARSDLKEAQTKLTTNTYRANNREQLFDEGRIDQDQYENIDDVVEESEKKLEELQNKIRTLEDRLENLVITSSSAGIVTEKPLSTNAGDAFLVLVKPNPMIVNFALAAHEATSIKPGQTVTVRFRDIPGEKVFAKVVSIGTEINPESNTFEARASFANPTFYFKVGMEAEVEFQSSKRQKYFVVPAEAVITSKRRHYVFTVIKGAAHRIRIVPRETHGAYTEIIEGLREDDLIVVKGHERLEEGTTVDIWGR